MTRLHHAIFLDDVLAFQKELDAILSGAVSISPSRASSVASSSSSISSDTDGTVDTAAFLMNSLAINTYVNTKDPIEVALNRRDERGNTPLHLAIMLNRVDMVHALIQTGKVSCFSSNALGWYPLDEAISYGNVAVIQTVMQRYQQESSANMARSLKPLIKAFSEGLGDFFLEMKWDFHSWDRCRIWKFGDFVRMDTSLIGFDRGRWLHGDISIIAKLDVDGPVVHIIDHEHKLRQQIFPRLIDASKSPEQLERDTIVEYMRSPLLQTRLETTELSIKHHKSIGTNLHEFFHGKKDKKKLSIEYVGDYVSTQYDIDNVRLRTILRTEHLSEERLNELGMESWYFIHANSQGEEKSNVERLIRRRISVKEEEVDIDGDDNTSCSDEGIDVASELNSLPAPSETNEVDLADYFLDSNEPLHLGRPIRLKEHQRDMKARVWMSSADLLKSDKDEDKEKKGKVFPLSVQDMVTLLEVLDLGHDTPLDGNQGQNETQRPIHQLKEFIKGSLPPGFPVRIEIPMLTILTAQITFTDFMEWPKGDPMPESMPRPKTSFIGTPEDDISSCTKEEINEKFFSVPMEYRQCGVLPSLNSSGATTPVRRQSAP